MANIYLHYVFDLWIAQWRRLHTSGEMIVVRYADDFLVGFQEKEDAERLLLHLRERLAQFALELHPDKTRVIEFGRYAAKKRARRGLGQPDTFNFLGFTHLCGLSRKRAFVLMRHSMSKRMARKLKAVRVALRKRRHQPINRSRCRDIGWRKFFVAMSTTTVFQPTVRRSTPSEAN